jgi:ABC-type dipeptide/oligopeptide/nickel transport system permease subunit
VLKHKGREYVMAARLLGTGPARMKDRRRFHAGGSGEP